MYICMYGVLFHSKIKKVSPSWLNFNKVKTDEFGSLKSWYGMVTSLFITSWPLRDKTCSASVFIILATTTTTTSIIPNR